MKKKFLRAMFFIAMVCGISMNAFAANVSDEEITSEISDELVGGTGVAIDKAHFPDDVFRAKIAEKDTNKDGYLSDTELYDITAIEINREGNIKDFTGLEYFEQLQWFAYTCDYDSDVVKSIDFSHNPELRVLKLTFCRAEEIDLSKNFELYQLEIKDSNLSKLTLDNNSELQELVCGYNEKLESIDLSKNTKLVTLNCQGAAFKVLDLRNNTLLEEVHFAVCNNLDKIIFSDNNVIKKLDFDAYNEAAKNLDYSLLPNLEELSCISGTIPSLDLSSCTKLKKLEWLGTGLTSLNVSNCAELIEMDCSNADDVKLNHLKTIELNGCVKLKKIKLDRNEFTAIDFTGLPELEEVSMYANKLETVNISTNHKLKKINFQDNALTNIDVSELTELEELILDDNRLEKIDLSHNTNLIKLYLGRNKLDEIDISKNINLEEVVLNSNYIYSVNIANNSKLERLEIIISCENKSTITFDPAKLDVSKIKDSKGLSISGNKIILDNSYTQKDLFGDTWYYHMYSYDGGAGRTVYVDFLHRTKIENTTSNVVTEQFTDVAPSKWYVPAVQYALDNGIMSGTTANTFEPDKPCTRAMMVTILYSAMGKPAVSGTTPFTDLKANWYKTPVLWAYQNNVTKGQTDTTFAPDKNVARQEMAVFLYSFAKHRGNDTSATADLNKFVDISQLSSWATPQMQWANANGIINGKGGGKLDPKGNATRAEVAAMIMSFQNKFGK